MRAGLGTRDTSEVGEVGSQAGACAGAGAAPSRRIVSTRQALALSRRWAASRSLSLSPPRNTELKQTLYSLPLTGMLYLTYSYSFA